ncbi:hypothetical protein [Sansalvadorimonas verongulae]|uniref:hypothetical protein n=1 Tax=Sansalvadorimonas verongulae TaxID=2172824 RepID=UPI0012BCE2E6|nr:hypothetical protein [Sansalvadorimonas verongulae]MTI12298.1 hypothetical protein [Sansalvadorimonas verongulae]
MLAQQDLPILRTLKKLYLSLPFLLALPFMGSAWAEDDLATTLVVLYKDKTGNVRAETDNNGATKVSFRSDLVKSIASIDIDTHALGINPGGVRLDGKAIPSEIPFRLPLGGRFANSQVDMSWELVEARPRRSSLETMGRLLIPFAGAVAALGGLEPTYDSDGELIHYDYVGTNFSHNVGHYLIMATMHNLADEIDTNLANLLEDHRHHLGGVISPEWAAKGAVAVIMFGGGGLKNVSKKVEGIGKSLSLGQATRFFAQSRTISVSNLFLGEVSGQMVDRVTSLSPEVRKVVTKALGGVATGGLYTLLTSAAHAKDSTTDLHGKISNAGIIGVSKAVTPFVRDFVGDFTKNKTLEHMGTHAVMTSLTLPIAAGVYGLLYLSSDDIQSLGGAGYLTRLAGGSFAKMAGYSMGNIFGKDTLKSYFGDSWGAPLAMSATFVATAMLANAGMIQYNRHSFAGSAGKEFFLKLRDGIYIATLMNGTTAVIEDVFRRGAPLEQSVRLNLRFKPIQVTSVPGLADTDSSHENESERHREL